MPELRTIYDYMRAHAALLGQRILQEYPALHQFDEPVLRNLTLEDRAHNIRSNLRTLLEGAGVTADP